MSVAVARRTPRAFAALLLAALAILAAGTAPARAAVELTPAERAWLARAPDVVVGIEEDYAPFDFTDARGRAQGYSVDLFRIAAERVGLRYRFATGMAWDDVLAGLRRGEIHVITCAWENDQRRAYLAFVEPPYLQHVVGVAVRADDPRPPQPGTMQGRRLAVVPSFALDARLRAQNPGAVFVEVASPREALRRVSFGEADAYIDNVSLIQHLAVKHGFGNLRISGEVVVPGAEYHMAVTRTQPELHAILTKALADVTEAERRQLARRWLYQRPTFWEGVRPYLLPVAGGLLAVLATLVLLASWNRRLRREVQRREAAEAAAAQRADEAARSAQLQDSLLRAAQVAILVLDAEGRWILVNPFAERLLGWRADELLGRVVRHGGPPRDDTAPMLLEPAYVEDTVRRLERRTGQPVATDWTALYALAEMGSPPTEVRMLRKDGSGVPVQLSLARVSGADGRPLGLVAIATDLTEQKRLQRELAASEAQAREANAAKSAFLASMSHEIRTPLNGVVGMIEVLAHTPLDPDQRHIVGIVQQSSQVVLRIIGDILDFSKIEAGRLELAPAPVDVAALVRDAAEGFVGVASEKGLALSTRVDPAVAGWHLADGLRLRQILANLLSNAIKFTEQGRVDVSLAHAGHADTPDGPRDRLRLVVADTGIGMSASQQARVFAPFVQGDEAVAQRFGGTGLGLAICQRLAALMHARLVLESEPGQGTRVSLELALPRVPEPVREPGTAPAFVPRAAPPREQALRAGRLVLLVDDHPTNRLVVARQLALAGFACDTAGDGDEALERWRDTAYGAVLTDVHMTRMDGYALTRALRAAEATAGRAHTPVIALTANALKGAEDECRAAGMDDYLAKPVAIATLRSALERWLPAPADAPEADALPSTRPAPATAAPAPAFADDGQLDAAVLAALAGGDPHAADALLRDFLASTADDLERLRSARAAGDPAALARQAHRLKGAALLVGARRLAQAAGGLEQAAAGHDPVAIERAQLGVEVEAEALRHLAELRDAAR